MLITLSTLTFIGIVLVGLLVGSFLNVCIYRLPRDLSPAKGRSYCPACQTKIAWYDNVPMLSFLWLGGRCRRCRATISLRYPLVEFMTAMLALSTYLYHPSWISFSLYFFLFVAPLIVVVFIDLDTLTIPDVITLPGIGAGILTSVLVATDWQRALIQSGLGIAVGGGLLLLLAWYSVRIRHKEGLGGGDIKLAAMLGAFLGPADVMLVLTLASLIGLVLGGLTLFLYKKGKDTPIPFGPFLVLAAFIVFFFRTPLWAWLIQLRTH